MLCDVLVCKEGTRLHLWSQPYGNLQMVVYMG